MFPALPAPVTSDAVYSHSSIRRCGLLLGLLGALRLELGVEVVTGVGARQVKAVPNDEYKLDSRPFEYSGFI